MRGGQFTKKKKIFRIYKNALRTNSNPTPTNIGTNNTPTNGALQTNNRQSLRIKINVI